jgi:hypothetical protein
LERSKSYSIPKLALLLPFLEVLEPGRPLRSLDLVSVFIVYYEPRRIRETLRELGVVVLLLDVEVWQDYLFELDLFGSRSLTSEYT